LLFFNLLQEDFDRLKHDFKQLDFLPFSPLHKRIEAVVSDGNETLRVTKGSPQVVFSLLTPQDQQLLKNEFDSKVRDAALRGFRTIAVAVQVSFVCSSCVCHRYFFASFY